MKSLLNSLLSKIRGEAITEQAKAERQRDHANPDNKGPDAGPQAIIAACGEWLCIAQDHNAAGDGGVARDFSLIKGLSTSYPERPGYIIRTMIQLAKHTGDESYLARARKMLDWCVAIQFPEGGFQGGKIDAQPLVPVTFNTGQILIGLSAGVAEFGDAKYVDAMNRAAAWLRDSLDADGCWRKHATPFAEPGDKAYETHVAWGLFEAERLSPGNGYGDAGFRQIEWALTKQQSNGWFKCNCLTNPEAPLTHTIGYVTRGILEAYRLNGNKRYLEAAALLANEFIPSIGPDGRLAGRLNAKWGPMVDYVCLTGSVQLAHCLFLIAQFTGKKQYIEPAKKLNAFVRRAIQTDGPIEQRGGVKGSYPVDGDYGQWEYLNWAAKFCIDSNLLELETVHKIEIG